MAIVLACHKGIGPTVTGTALVAQDNFSAATAQVISANANSRAPSSERPPPRFGRTFAATTASAR